MKLLRSLALGAALVAAASTTALAQGGGGGGGGGRGTQMLLRDITLSAEQQTKVDSVTAFFRTQMPARVQGQMPDSATMAKMREVNTKRNDAIRALLTDEQKKTFDKNVEEQRQRMQQGGGGRPPASL